MIKFHLVVMKFTKFLSFYYVFFPLFHWKRSHLLGFTGFYWVIIGLRGKMGLVFDQVLLSRDEIYRVFTGFYWVLRGFTGFYRVIGLSGKMELVF